MAPAFIVTAAAAHIFAFRTERDKNTSICRSSQSRSTKEKGLSRAIELIQIGKQIRMRADSLCYGTPYVALFKNVHSTFKNSHSMFKNVHSMFKNCHSKFKNFIQCSRSLIQCSKNVIQNSKTLFSVQEV